MTNSTKMLQLKTNYKSVCSIQKKNCSNMVERRTSHVLHIILYFIQTYCLKSPEIIHMERKGIVCTKKLLVIEYT